MKLGMLFTVNALLAVAFGLAFVLVPAEFLQQYGVTVNSGTVVLARLFGATLVGLAVLCWLARTAPVSEGLRAIMIGLFAIDALGFVAALQGVLSGAVNSLGWSTVILYGVLGLAWGYFAFGRSAATSVATR